MNIKKNIATLSIAIVIMTGASIMLLDEPGNHDPCMSAVTHEELTSIDIARQSVFFIDLVDYPNSATAILTGRKKLTNNLYQYRAITAYHVLGRMQDAITLDDKNASRKLGVVFQPSFHGEVVRWELEVEHIDLVIPAHDLISFTFISERRLECIPIATEEEFKSINFTDRIYAIGCGGSFVMHIRGGNVGSTNNKNGYEAQDYNPYNYFRPAVSVWYGDSGGAIISEDGKLIGMIQRFGLTERNFGFPIAHTCVSLKSYIILEIVKNNKEFFLIEDY